MKKLLVMILMVGMLIGVGSCCFCFPGEEPKKAKKQQTINVLPGIRSFLEYRPEYGSPISVQYIPDSVVGKRQRVQFSTGRNLLFYLEKGQVIVVYERSPLHPPIWEL